MAEKKKFIIYDTTLRDGMQGTGINFTLEDKLSIAHKLDELGFDYIEGGFPLSNDKEAEFFNRVKKEKFGHAKIVAFGSTRKPKKKAESDPHIQALIESETSAVIVVGKTWKAHVEYVLCTSPEENLEMIFDSIRTLKASVGEVFLDCEHFFDGFKDDPDYALKVLRTGAEAGADTLVLCDTNGGTLPSEVSRIISSLPIKELVPLGVHFHDDTGTSVAASIAGVEAGAVQVQGTVNGWGERCGNANLCVVVPNLVLKLGYTAYAASHLNQFTSLSRFVAEKANIIPDKRQPYVGEAAFSHKAGQHVDVITKAPHLMEHISSELVGNERKIILSELAGKSTIVKKLEKYGEFDKSSAIVNELISKLKKLEQEGYEYEAAEASFDILARKLLNNFKQLFVLDNYQLESYKFGDTPSKTVGKILVRVNDKEVLGASVRIGPVEALDNALRDALLPAYPFMSKIKLVDYKVRVLDPESATSAKVRVFITSSDGEKSWDTVGVSEDIIEASWQALVDSLDYYYNNFVYKNNQKKE
jgi:2-isopropylmalate synthase